jgi:flagellar hook-length control protein FliK
VDPQIGSDIAKLLGNLGKSTGSSSNSAASSDAGTAFKRALAASRQAQAEQTSGKGLPVQPGRSEALQQRSRESVAVSEPASIAAQVPSDQVATAALPGFDLQIVGSPSEQSAVLKFAKEAGLSDETLAQLFQLQRDGATSIDLKAASSELAASVAKAINEWVTAAVERPITSDAPASGADSAALQLSNGKLEALIAPSLIAMAPDAKAFPDTISRQLAADLEPVVQNWISHLSPALSDRSPQALADAIAPTVARWLSGDAASSQMPQVSAEAVAAKITESLAPLLATSAVTGSALRSRQIELNTPTPTGTGTPNLQRELEAAVAQWVKVSPAADGLVVTDEWIRDAAQRVAPAVAEWAAAGSRQERVTHQLIAQITPELSRALQSLTGQAPTAMGQPLADLPSAVNLANASPAPAITQQATLSALPSAVIAAAGMAGMGSVTDSEMSTIRASALSQPQPISLSIVGQETENGRATAQGLASALAQVMAPARRPAAEAGLLAQPATLDRFALRGVNVRPESNEIAKAANNVTAETVKSATVDSVASLRELVTARSLELARLSSSNDKPASTLSAQQNPMAGFGLPEGTDNTTTRLAGQSEASFRQSLAATDRPIAADASRSNQFAFSQNTVAREMVSRQLSEALGQRLAANIAAGHYRLTFNVNPKELGAIDVVMEMRDGRLDAQINTGNAVTRELLGDSLPRLRDALTQSGINLAQLQVGSESQQGNAQGRQAESERAAQQAQEEMGLADATTDLVSEDLELGLDLDSVDFWA